MGIWLVIIIALGAGWWQLAAVMGGMKVLAGGRRAARQTYQRRTKLADSVGAFVALLAERQKHLRQLELMRALERRSQERVKLGVTETAEQVTYLEKVATVEGALLKQRGDLQKARLELIGHCAPTQADDLDRHIMQFMPAADRR